jgi:hypothetical protein
VAFDRNVFVNCPFDRAYRPLLRPLMFTILALGLTPRIALETIDSGQPRLARIIDLIRAARYSVHDLSRLRAEQPGDFFRLNMPFELGLDLGCRTFGDSQQQGKKTLVLEADAHRYRHALSDMAGFDIEAHGDSPRQVVAAVRRWLVNACGLQAPGPTKVWGDFNDFMADDADALKADGHSDADIDDLAVPELIARMQAWLAARARPAG